MRWALVAINVTRDSPTHAVPWVCMWRIKLPYSARWSLIRLPCVLLSKRSTTIRFFISGSGNGQVFVFQQIRCEFWLLNDLNYWKLYSATVGEGWRFIIYILIAFSELVNVQEIYNCRQCSLWYKLILWGLKERMEFKEENGKRVFSLNKLHSFIENSLRQKISLNLFNNSISTLII